MKKGFTLIELLIFLVILGIISTTIISVVKEFRKNNSYSSYKNKEEYNEQSKTSSGIYIGENFQVVRKNTKGNNSSSCIFDLLTTPKNKEYSASVMSMEENCDKYELGDLLSLSK